MEMQLATQKSFIWVFFFQNFCHVLFQNNCLAQFEKTMQLKIV